MKSKREEIATTRRNHFKSLLISTGIIISTATTNTCCYPFFTTTNTVANAIPEQKSYSSNARNFERLSNGDSSGGSVYNNSPVTPVSAKRRAMVGCKVNNARDEVSRLENASKVMSEKDCNMRVMGGDTEFMLGALRKLECPTCPYGIEGA
mmetsp:Transcript_15831/g.18389  ORF Transcript_15831/g.18389 Transcript_15831/m.18389 type:complete len:151 (+) Transcript_15831:2-454(+)